MSNYAPAAAHKMMEPAQGIRFFLDLEPAQGEKQNGNKTAAHQHHQHHHRHESHGRDEQIDENTPVEEVKAPNVFERAKEEIEAVVQHIHEKRKTQNNDSGRQSESHGFWPRMGKLLERCCSPGPHPTSKNSN